MTGSTNADLLGEGRTGAPEGLVLVSDHQTAGRGRQDRSFHDEPGGAVLMSVLLRPRPDDAFILPFVMGLAAVEGAGAFLPPADDGADRRTGTSDAPGGDASGGSAARLGLKWPNDVLVPELGDRKLAGILAEATSAGGELVVVVGIGMNLRWTTVPPAEVAARSATLEEVAGHPVERWEVARSILARLDNWLGVVERSGPAAVLDPYRERCLTIGRRIRLQTPSGVLGGVASGVADSGALVLDTADGPVEVMAGDAHHC